jgi:hypothetical protein
VPLPPKMVPVLPSEIGSESRIGLPYQLGCQVERGWTVGQAPSATVAALVGFGVWVAEVGKFVQKVGVWLKPSVRDVAFREE